MFERLYAAAMVCGGISTALDWVHWKASVPPGFHWTLPVACALWLILRGALWFFVARRPMGWARLAVTGLAIVALGRLLFNVLALIVDAAPSLPAVLAGTGSAGLHIVAAAYLFRRDTRAWFAEEHGLQTGGQG